MVSLQANSCDEKWIKQNPFRSENRAEIYYRSQIKTNKRRIYQLQF